MDSPMTIWTKSRGGGGNYTRYLMTYTKDAYQISRNEGHDYNNHKVTIRKTMAQQGSSQQPTTRSESKSK